MQLALQLGFSCNDHLQLHCNSMYFYNMSVIGQVASIGVHATHHMWNRIHIQLSSLHVLQFNVVFFKQKHHHHSQITCYFKLYFTNQHLKKWKIFSHHLSLIYMQINEIPRITNLQPWIFLNKQKTYDDLLTYFYIRKTKKKKKLCGTWYDNCIITRVWNAQNV